MKSGDTIALPKIKDSEKIQFRLKTIHTVHVTIQYTLLPKKMN